MDDYSVRAQVGFLSLTLRGYNSTHDSFNHSMQLSTPVFNSRSSRQFGESGYVEIDIHKEPDTHYCYSSFYCTNLEGYKERVEHKHDCCWYSEVRLNAAVEALNVFESISKNVLTNNQYYEALYFIYDNHIKHYVGKQELVDHYNRKREQRPVNHFDNRSDVQKWVALLTACIKRNTLPEWVRSSMGEPFVL